MRNKKKFHMMTFLFLLEKQYFEKFEFELKPVMFHLDCEQATITALLNNFPETSVTLCFADFLESFYRKFIFKFKLP
jgi:hypothetical protein